MIGKFYDPSGGYNLAMILLTNQGHDVSKHFLPVPHSPVAAGPSRALEDVLFVSRAPATCHERRAEHRAEREMSRTESAGDSGNGSAMSAVA